MTKSIDPIAEMERAHRIAQNISDVRLRKLIDEYLVELECEAALIRSRDLEETSVKWPICKREKPEMYPAWCGAEVR